MSFEVNFYAGQADSWGFELTFSPYETAFTMMIIHWYFGFSIWRKSAS
jgi:hypothetical protein